MCTTFIHYFSVFPKTMLFIGDWDNLDPVRNVLYNLDMCSAVETTSVCTGIRIQIDIGGVS